MRLWLPKIFSDCIVITENNDFNLRLKIFNKKKIRKPKINFCLRVKLFVWIKNLDFFSSIINTSNRSTKVTKFEQSYYFQIIRLILFLISRSFSAIFLIIKNSFLLFIDQFLRYYLDSSKWFYCYIGCDDF